MKIYVGNLAFRTDEQSLRSHFSTCGEVTDVHIVMDRATGRSKGFGFITFSSDGAVDAALALSGQELDGRPLRVDRATGESRSSGGGNRGGNGGGFGGGHRPSSRQY